VLHLDHSRVILYTIKKDRIMNYSVEVLVLIILGCNNIYLQRVLLEFVDAIIGVCYTSIAVRIMRV
jgi:hypothetical protein